MRMLVQLLEFENVDKLFPSDVIKRAKEYLDAIPGGTGAYSDSQGAAIIREQIAKVKPCLIFKHKRPAQRRCSFCMGGTRLMLLSLRFRSHCQCDLQILCLAAFLRPRHHS